MGGNMKQSRNIEKQNKRRFSRVNTYLPFAMRRVSPRERKQAKSRIDKNALILDFTIPPPVNEPLLAGWLLRLNNKLDAIINLLSPETKGFLPITFKILNIGGNGMRFSSRVTYKIGDFLEIQMVLYTHPCQVLYIYGVVVRAELGDDNDQCIALEFVDLDEEVRQELMNFDFKKHRETLQRIIDNRNLDNLIMLR
jgi:hypothetical protein